MDQGSQVVIIYHPNQGDHQELKRAIATAIGPDVTPQQVIISKRTHGITAYVELPSQLANSICEKKTIQVDGKPLNIKLFYCDHQIFINKLPSNITSQDVEEYFGKFGRVLKVIIQKSTTTSYQARHCYIKFENNQEANDIIYHQKRHIIKNQEVKVHRTYGKGESDITDKKFFLKIEPKVDKVEEMEKTLHNIFRKYGELRERIRIQDTSGNSNKAVVTFVSHQQAQNAFKNEKQRTIEKYKIILRPYSSDLAIYGYGIKPELSEQQVRKVFQIYGKVIECRISGKTGLKSVTINYALEQHAKLVMADYLESKEICSLFNLNKPKLTFHMTTRQRNQFNDFHRKNKKKDWGNQAYMGNFQPMQPVIPNQMYPQQNFGQQSYNMKNQYPKMGMEQLQQMNYEFSNQNPQNIPNIPYIPPNSNMPSNIPQNMPVNMMNTNLPPNMPPNMNLPTVGMGYSRQPQIGKQA